ncbi:unnamed protein product [Heterobilharzia americana]|nr:unnamed protein product [Heterobilharzia americana]
MTVNSDSLTFCPRLIDYLAFVSCEGHPILEGICNQTPKLLKCYPPNKHHDFILPNDVVYFCQPEGCISSSLASTRLGTTTFVFTLTDKDADKTRFGICLNFYRPCSVTYSVSLNNESKGNQVSDPLHFRTKEEHLNDNNKQSILTSLCLISHHPFFSKFRQCLHSLKEIIDRCDEYCRNLYGADNTFYSFWSTLLTGGSIKKASFNRLESQIVYEIESWIIHLLNAPVPLPGKTCLHLSVGPEAFYEKLVFALPDKTRLTLIDFPLHLPLELLGMETCLKVLTAIMLEQKVVLQSRDYNALTMSVMAFTAMLYPLQYMFPAIPLLPNSLEGGENVITTFSNSIYNWHPSYLLSQKTDFRFPADVWLVDLDTNKMMGSSLLEPIPTLPEKEGQELCQNLHQALVSMTADSGSDGEPTEMESKALSKSLNSVDSADVATRVAMVRFFNSLNVLGNIAEHTRTVRLFPRPVVAFQRFSFLKSRQILTPFTRKLAETQAVEFFAEWCLYPENEVFQRIHAGIHDPEQIGDKVIWYENTLAQINFEIWSTEETNRYTALNFIHSVSIDNGHINNFEMIHHHFPKSTNTTYDLNALYNPPETLEDLLRNAVQLQQPMRKNQPKRRPNQQSEQVDSFDSSSAKMQMMRSTKSDDVNQAILYEKKNLPGPMYTIPSMAESSSDSSDDQDDSDIWDLKNSVDQLDMKKDTNKMNPMETVARIDNLTNELTGENFKQNIGSENLIVNSSVNVATLRKPSLHRLSTPQQYANHLQLNDDDEEKKRIVHYNEEQSEVVLDKDERKEDEEVVDVNDDEDDMEQTSVGKYLLNNLSDNIADAASHASTAISGLINKQKTIVRKSGNLMKKMATEIQTSAKHDLKINDSIVTTDPSNNVYKSKEFSGHKQDVDLIQSASKFVLNLPKKQIFHFGANQTRQQEEQLSNRSRTISVKESSSNLVNVEKSYADQEFLRELVQCIHEKKTGITTKFSVNRLRDLLNDENYRNYLMLKLNRELSKSFEDPDECIPDVAIINMEAYKTYIWLLQSMIRGLEQTCTNHGIGGLASAMMLLELCHTHYLDMRSNTVSPIKSQGSQNSTVDQSRDDEILSLLSLDGYEQLLKI